MATDAKLALLSWVLARGQSVVAQKSVEQANNQLNDIKATLAAEKASKVDVLRVEALVAQNEFALADAKSQEFSAEQRLRTVLHAGSDRQLAIGVDVFATPGARASMANGLKRPRSSEPPTETRTSSAPMRAVKAASTAGASTTGARVRPGSRRPAGPNHGQAVSARARAGRVGGVDKHNGRRLDPGGGRQGLDRDPGRVGQTGQRHAHLLVLLPEQIGDRDGLALGPGRVAIDGDQAVGAQVGDVGEGLPHIRAAAMPPGEASTAWARWTAKRIAPVSVISSSPRTRAGAGTMALTGLTSPDRTRSRARAERWPVEKKSMCG